MIVQTYIVRCDAMDCLASFAPDADATQPRSGEGARGRAISNGWTWVVVADRRYDLCPVHAKTPINPVVVCKYTQARPHKQPLVCVRAAKSVCHDCGRALCHEHADYHNDGEKIVVRCASGCAVGELAATTAGV